MSSMQLNYTAPSANRSIESCTEKHRARHDIVWYDIDNYHASTASKCFARSYLPRDEDTYDLITKPMK
jgi:hypothetical protein